MKHLLLAAGSNAKGQLGLGHTEDSHAWSSVPFHEGISRLASGAGHTVILDEEGQISYVGDTSRGQLGSQQAEPIVDWRQKCWPIFGDKDTYNHTDVFACWETTLILSQSAERQETRKSRLETCGANDFGELGRPISQTIEETQPGQVALPSKLSSSDAGTTQVVHMAAGPRHVILITEGSLSDQTVFGWGAARKGQLANIRQDGTYPKYISEPKSILLPSEFADASRNPRVHSIAAGKDHTLLLISTTSNDDSQSDSEYHILAAGSNAKGQLGSNLPASRQSAGWTIIGCAEQARSASIAAERTKFIPVSVHCTWNSSFVVFSDGNNRKKVLSFGANDFGQLGHPEGTSWVDIDDEVESIACGSEHVLATMQNGDVWGWGWNEHGNLGHLDFPHSVEPKKLWTAPKEAQVKVFAGNGTSWIHCTTPD